MLSKKCQFVEATFGSVGPAEPMLDYDLAGRWIIEVGLYGKNNQCQRILAGLGKCRFIRGTRLGRFYCIRNGIIVNAGSFAKLKFREK